MIRLVVNADDLGLDRQIDRGIFAAHEQGIVTSASLLATGPTATEAAQQAKQRGLSLGLHLCLTSELSSASTPEEVPGLAPGGHLRRSWRQVVADWLTGRIDLREVDREFRSQLDLARELGIEVDHLDSHQHLHLLPGISKVVRQIAKEERLPVRWPMEAPRAAWIYHPARAVKSLTLSTLAAASRDRKVKLIRGLGVFEAGILSESRLLSLLRALPDGDWEIGCHPGMNVTEVSAEPGWQYGWDEELQALCSPKVRAVIQQRSLVLTDYRGLTSTR